MRYDAFMRDLNQKWEALSGFPATLELTSHRPLSAKPLFRPPPYRLAGALWAFFLGCVSLTYIKKFCDCQYTMAVDDNGLQVSAA
jgi:hypothetical protein